MVTLWEKAKEKLIQEIKDGVIKDDMKATDIHARYPVYKAVNIPLFTLTTGHHERNYQQNDRKSSSLPLLMQQASSMLMLRKIRKIPMKRWMMTTMTNG
jgi:hypothetical protein